MWAMKKSAASQQRVIQLALGLPLSQRVSILFRIPGIPFPPVAMNTNEICPSLGRDTSDLFVDLPSNAFECGCRLPFPYLRINRQKTYTPKRQKNVIGHSL
jgi:hypothetical protein